MKKTHLFWIIPLGLVLFFYVVGTLSDDAETTKEEKTETEHSLTGKSVESSEFKQMGSYKEIPCSDWPSKYKVGTFENKPISFVLNVKNKTVAYVDSSKNSSACAFVYKKKNSRLNSMFSSEGYHIGLVQRIKGMMNDPSTFEHVETKYGYYKDADNHVFLYMKFRGSNSFGAKVVNKVGAKVNLNNQILEFFEGNQMNRELENVKRIYASN